MLNLIHLLVFSFCLISCEPDNHITPIDDDDIDTSIVVKEGMNLVGKISANDKGIENVVVSDGYSVTTTDSDGIYQMIKNDSAKFVFVTIPENYTIPVKGNIPDFYKELDHSKKINYANFELEEKEPDNDFILVAIADPQPSDFYELTRFATETLPDIENSKSLLSNQTSFYGIVLGDIVWDKMNLFPEHIKAINSRLSFPVFHVIGNHDHDETVIDDDYAASHKYEEFFGPAYYSCNIGDVHLVVLDNIVYNGRSDYSGTISSTQLNWLKENLKYVSKDKLLVIGLHIPTKRRASSTAVTNNDDLYSILSGYTVRILSGHTHTNFSTSISSSIEENTLGTACGAFWSGDICSDGTPNGYGIYEFKGNTISNWHYKGTKNSNTDQIKLYPTGSWSSRSNSIIANIWNWHSDWTISLYQDGIYRSSMTKYNDYDPLAYDTMFGTSKPARHPTAAQPSKTDHLFYYTPVGQWSMIRVDAEDSHGNTYSQIIYKSE